MHKNKVLVTSAQFACVVVILPYVYKPKYMPTSLSLVPITGILPGVLSFFSSVGLWTLHRTSLLHHHTLFSGWLYGTCCLEGLGERGRLLVFFLAPLCQGAWASLLLLLLLCGLRCSGETCLRGLEICYPLVTIPFSPTFFFQAMVWKTNDSSLNQSPDMHPGLLLPKTLWLSRNSLHLLLLLVP